MRICEVDFRSMEWGGQVPLKEERGNGEEITVEACFRGRGQGSNSTISRNRGMRVFSMFKALRRSQSAGVIASDRRRHWKRKAWTGL